MSDYINEHEKNLILAQIENLQSILENETDPNRRSEIINKINGLKQRLTYGKNPDRGF